MRPIPVFAALFLFAANTAGAQGLSARFEYIRAVEGEPLIVRVAVDGLPGAVGSVVVEARKSGDESWTSMKSVREGDLFVATFPASSVPSASQTLELRATALGKRGGLLVELGFDEPLLVEVLKASEAEEDRRVLDAPQAKFGLIGWIGAEGRAGSSARVRGTVGLGYAIFDRLDVGALLVVGPAFRAPAKLADGGDIVLGVEAIVRGYPIDPERTTFVPWAQAFASADFRLPGFDPGLGLRAGVTWNFSSAARLEGSIGGAIVAFRANDDPFLGASGSARVALRFGGAR